MTRWRARIPRRTRASPPRAAAGLGSGPTDSTEGSLRRPSWSERRVLFINCLQMAQFLQFLSCSDLQSGNFNHGPFDSVYTGDDFANSDDKGEAQASLLGQLRRLAPGASLSSSPFAACFTAHKGLFSGLREASTPRTWEGLLKVPWGSGLQSNSLLQPLRRAEVGGRGPPRGADV